MRAARAAKGEPGSPGGGGLQGQLEGLIGESRGSVVDFLLQAALPLLKPLIDELCDKEPQQRSAQLALWLLEQAGAPRGPLLELRSWSQLVPEVQPPAVARKDSGGTSPKTRALQRAGLEAAAAAAVGPPAEDGLALPPGDASRELACPPAVPGTPEARHSHPELALSGGGSGTHQKSRRRVSIWQMEHARAEDEKEEEEDEEEEEDGGLRDEESGLKAMLRLRGSINAAGPSSPSTVKDQRRRRFTVNLSKQQLEPPPPHETAALLRKVPAFSGCSEQDLAKIVAVARCNRYEADENLMVHGCVADHLHVVVEGTGRVCVPHQVATVKRGDFFGVAALSLAASTSDSQISAVGGPVTTISIASADYQRLNLKSRMTKVDQSKKARKCEAQGGHRENPREAGPADVCGETGRARLKGYEQTATDRAVIAKAVRHNKLLGEVLKLSEEQCGLIADSVYLIALPRGEVLFRRGDRGKSLYIVQVGTLEVTVDEHVGEPVLVRAGDSFGELAILYDSPRTASIAAASDSLLWVLSSADFKLVTRLAYRARIEEYTSIVSRIPCIAQALQPDDVHLVADVLEEFTVYEGEDVCVQGEDEDLLFIIFKGGCVALKDGQVERSLGRGDWVGEAQLVRGVPAEATVRATTELVTVLALDKSSLQAVLHATSSMGKGPLMASTRSTGAADMAGGKSLGQVGSFVDRRDKEKHADTLFSKRLSRGPNKAMLKRQQEHDLHRTEQIGALGEGSFGSVVLLRDTTSDQFYALKALSKEHITRENMGMCVQNERSVMSLLDSDFVVRLFMTYQDQDNLFFMMEPVMGGELFDVYHDRDFFGDLAAAKFYIACVTLGLQHLHLKRVIYRDLKLENCLIDASGYLKLTDMGIAKVVIGKTYTICGTSDYFAPETLKQTGHNRAVDWWACGVLLFIMCTGRSPFDAPEVTQIYKNIMKGFSKVSFPESLPSDLVDVIKALCRKKPEERVTMQKGGVANLQEMGFFAGFSWDQLALRAVPSVFVPPPPDLEKIAAKKLQREIDLCMETVQAWDGSLPEAQACSE